MHCIAETTKKDFLCFSMKMTPCRNNQGIPNRYQSFKQIPEIPKSELKKSQKTNKPESPDSDFQTGLKETQSNGLNLYKWLSKVELES